MDFLSTSCLQEHPGIYNFILPLWISFLVRVFETGSHYVDQTGLELKLVEILLPQLPKCWDDSLADGVFVGGTQSVAASHSHPRMEAGKACWAGGRVRGRGGRCWGAQPGAPISPSRWRSGRYSDDSLSGEIQEEFRNSPGMNLYFHSCPLWPGPNFGSAPGRLGAPHPLLVLAPHPCAVASPSLGAVGFSLSGSGSRGLCHCGVGWVHFRPCAALSLSLAGSGHPGLILSPLCPLPAISPKEGAFPWQHAPPLPGCRRGQVTGRTEPPPPGLRGFPGPSFTSQMGPGGPRGVDRRGSRVTGS
ncbi:uncharacterized protein LOC110350153 [Heterocephalus glaber]|uniref:Uncharacterized protein LOC110350153 n=1 Tax=Heterocephalus glaber TaxID=10181 RepID=A0AAX6T8I8_HETGA|nr:uncharacterized protein LOC110350153 [Heterocephalus glaber]